MNIFGFNRHTVRPLSAEYSPDPSIKVHEDLHETFEGLSIFTQHGFSSAEDVSFNSYTPLFLTETKKIYDILAVVDEDNIYPYYITTLITPSGRDVSLYVDSTTGVVSLTSIQHKSNSDIFEIEFISPIYCAIRSTTNNAVKFLTITVSNSSRITFDDRLLGYTEDTDPQLLHYVQRGNNITFFNKLSSYDDTIKVMLVTHTSVGNNLSAVQVPVSSISFFASGNTFSITPALSTLTSVNDTTWCSYIGSIDDFTNTVNTSKSITGIKNNHIISSSTNNVNFGDSRIGINVFPLKNQISPTGHSSRDNPFSSTEDAASHRMYRKLYTGAFCDRGADSIYTGYSSGVKQLAFPPDELTYFYTPQRLDPYVQLNINDAPLIIDGAVAANTPIKADKVFKRATERSAVNVIKDELNGTWLCSWLSGSANTNATPVWVDRYYNPNFITKTSALTAGIQSPILFVNKFTSITEFHGATAINVPVYDKLSDLIFEPGQLYAYYHSGKGNSQKIIDSLKQHLVVKDLKTYKTYNKSDIIPETEYNRFTHLMPDGRKYTEQRHTGASVEVPLLYTFNRDRFGITSPITHTGSFTLNFWMNSKDWTKPYASQILGNFISKGFGVFNEQFITPFIAIPDLDSVHIYNTDFKYIDTHVIGKTIKLFTKRGAVENYWIVDNNNDIYEYNINGTIQNKITSNLLTGVDLTDIDISDTHLYLLVRPGTSTATYFKYLLSSQVPSYVGELKTANIWNYGAGVSTLSSSKIHSVSKGVSSAEGVLITIHDSMSAITSDTVSVSSLIRIGKGSVIDNAGSPWTIQNNKLYTYDTSISSNIIGLSSNNIIEGVDCDRDNNIWVLHDKIKLAKFDNNRNLLFNISLTGLSTTTYNRYIDFISEFNSTGYSHYCITINESISGARFVKVSMDGKSQVHSSIPATPTKFITYTQPVQGSRKTVTGFDYLRKTDTSKEPKIQAKLSVANIYNSSTTTASYSAFTLSYCTSGMASGWNNINVLFDSEQGVYALYINTVLVDSKTIPRGRFSFSDIFDQPLTVGTDPFYTKLSLSEHTKQPQHDLADGIVIKNIKLYNKALDYFDIKAHYGVVVDSGPILWNVSTGQRNYIDTVERVFRYRIPGRRSESFNLNIHGSNITDPVLRKDIETTIRQNLEEFTPGHCNLHNILWDGVSITASNTSKSITSPVTVAAAQYITKPPPYGY